MSASPHLSPPARAALQAAAGRAFPDMNRQDPERQLRAMVAEAAQRLRSAPGLQASAPR